MAKSATADVRASVKDVEEVIHASIVKLADAVKIEGLKFFPDGVDLISITAKVGGVEVDLTVAGPKSGGRAADSRAAASVPALSTRPSMGERKL